MDASTSEKTRWIHQALAAAEHGIWKKLDGLHEFEVAHSHRTREHEDLDAARSGLAWIHTALGESGEERKSSFDYAKRMATLIVDRKLRQRVEAVLATASALKNWILTTEGEGEAGLVLSTRLTLEEARSVSEGFIRRGDWDLAKGEHLTVNYYLTAPDGTRTTHDVVIEG